MTIIIFTTESVEDVRRNRRQLRCWMDRNSFDRREAANVRTGGVSSGVESGGDMSMRPQGPQLYF